MSEEMLKNEDSTERATNVEQVENMQHIENAEYTGPRKTGLATAALVFGILALITTLFLINYIFGLIGLIMAIVYLCKKGKKYGKGRAIAGLVCAVLSIVISTGLYGGIYIYITTSSVTDLMDDVNKLTGGEVNPETIINDVIQSSIPDPTAIEQMIGKELNYQTLCEFVGEEVSLTTIKNFVGDGIDSQELATLMSEIDGSAIINDLGGELTYKAMEEKIGEDFTYEELKAYLEGFTRTE